MDTADMSFRLALLLWLLNFTTAQDPKCVVFQNITVGPPIYVGNREYPANYSAGQSCRWIFRCPAGYNLRLDCSEVFIPQSPGCTMDRLLVSRTGDPQLTGASTHCGPGSLYEVSRGQLLSLGLISNKSSPGGRFYCKLTAQAATPVKECSCGERRQFRIVGGEETAINEFAMMAGLVEVGVPQIKCGAVIITNEHVLTAAQCVSTTNLAVIVGAHNVYHTSDSPFTRGYRVSNIIVHPQFDRNTYANDIAIVQTAGPIEFNIGVYPACLPFKSADKSLAGDKVTMLGWGTLFPGGPTSNVLRKVDVEVVSESSCRAQIPSVTNRQICTFAPGKNASQDDSGGPLLFTNPATGLLFNVGIISYGRSGASNEPSINTRVSSYLSWIETNAPYYTFCKK